MVNFFTYASRNCCSSLAEISETPINALEDPPFWDSTTDGSSRRSVAGLRDNRRAPESSPRSKLMLDSDLRSDPKFLGAGLSDHYQIRQFADLAGVTVRALHHYDGHIWVGF